MRVFVLSSGSSGNALLVESQGVRVLVDAGLGPRVAADRLRALGADLFPRSVDAIVCTHHHGDHLSHVEPLARATKAPLFMHRGIVATRARKRWDVREYDVTRPFRVGPLEVRATQVPHDAPQVALAIGAPSGEAGPRFGVATDLGHVPRGLVELIGDCDSALVEANYCPVMLEGGPYPPHLKRRITGGFGHLANEQVAELAAALAGSRLARLYLGHLSRSNNSPERALAVVRPRCRGFTVEAIPHGAPRAIDVVSAGCWARGGVARHQLAFGF